MAEDGFEGPEEGDEVLLAQAQEYAERFGRALGEKLGAAGDPEQALRVLVAELRDDPAMLTLLRSAYEDGQREAVHEARKIFATDDGEDLTWETMGGGERIAVHRETHICNTCVHQAVCIVQRTIPGELLVQVRRCIAFSAE
jgi:hypothetical protein